MHDSACGWLILYNTQLSLKVCNRELAARNVLAALSAAACLQTAGSRKHPAYGFWIVSVRLPISITIVVVLPSTSVSE